MRDALGDAASSGARIVAALLKAHGARIALVFAGVLLPLWAFTELADEVHELEQFVFDEPLLLWAQAQGGAGLDQFFMVITRAGYAHGVIPMAVLLVLGLLISRRWRETTFAGISMVGASLLNMGAKRFFARDRPDLWESIAPEATFSFPSGHAMGSMALATVLVLLAWPTRLRWPVVVLLGSFVLLVGLSRIYLGVHYPSDILGGWVASGAWVVGVYLALYRGSMRPWVRGPAPATNG